MGRLGFCMCSPQGVCDSISRVPLLKFVETCYDNRMSLRLSDAAIGTYDALKRRPGAPVRRSDSRQMDALAAIHVRLRELIEAYRIGGHPGVGGEVYVFWTEIARELNAGAFDDLLDRV